MTIFRWLKRRSFRKLKKQNKITPEQFDRARLERLGVELKEFCDCFYKTGRLLTDEEHMAVIDAEHVIGTIDLLLSEDTDYGYIDQLIARQMWANKKNEQAICSPVLF